MDQHLSRNSGTERRSNLSIPNHSSLESNFMAKNSLHHLSSLLNCSILQFSFLIVKKQQLAAFLNAVCCCASILLAPDKEMGLGRDHSLDWQTVKRVLSPCAGAAWGKGPLTPHVALVEWPYFKLIHDKENAYEKRTRNKRAYNSAKYFDC